MMSDTDRRFDSVTNRVPDHGETDRPTSRLGRGLAALIGDVVHDGGESAERRTGIRRMPIDLLAPNPRNPRRIFGEEELEDLARSIRERGVIQPIVARPAGERSERYEIVAGERRWRAAQKAGLHDIPVVVRELDDREALEIAIIENVQRSDLNALEEAEGYQRLIDEFGHSHTNLGEIIGKSRSHVANTLRLLRLPDGVKDHLRGGRLTAGHARALVGHHDSERLAEEIVARDMNVRDVEALVRKPGGRTRGANGGARDADTRALEERLREVLGLGVELRHRADGTGELRLAYRTLEQLDALTRRLLGGRG